MVYSLYQDHQNTHLHCTYFSQKAQNIVYWLSLLYSTFPCGLPDDSQTQYDVAKYQSVAGWINKMKNKTHENWGAVNAKDAGCNKIKIYWRTANDNSQSERSVQVCPTKPVGIVQVNFLPIKLENLGDIWMIEFIMHKSNDTGTAMLLMRVVILQMSSSIFISQSKMASHIQFSNNQVWQGASTKTAKGAERQLSFSRGNWFH